MNYKILDSPIGALLLRADETALKEIRFPRKDEHPHQAEPEWIEGSLLLDEAIKQLEAYFAGERTDFDLPLNPDGTPFMKGVWAELLQIPFGTTRSYGELAAKIGKPTASRAVGAANGRNPIPIIIPCHRVIGANGSLTGFAGGIPLKEMLLNHERGSGQSQLTFP